MKEEDIKKLFDMLHQLQELKCKCGNIQKGFGECECEEVEEIQNTINIVEEL